MTPGTMSLQVLAQIAALCARHQQGLAEIAATIAQYFVEYIPGIRHRLNHNIPNYILDQID